MFTQPAFIRKNTPELKRKLEELGYRHSFHNGSHFTDGTPAIVTTICNATYASYKSLNNKACNILIKNNTIDCGTNEELFLAIAALRDDSDDMQWFTNGTNNWCRFGDKHISKTIDSMCINLHKATVEELIEHFKTE